MINSTNITNLTGVNDITNMGASISSFYSTDSSSNSSCSNDDDCLNNGSCLNQSTCSCQQGYWGSNCNFTQANSIAAANQNSQILDKLSNISLNSSNDTQKVAAVLVQMTSVAQINNDETVNKTFDLLVTLSASTDPTSCALIVSTVSNIINIVSSPNQNNSGSQMIKVMNIVSSVINSQLSSASANTPIVITTTNVVITAATLNTTDNVGLQLTLQTVLNSNDSNTQDSKVNVNDDFLNNMKGVGGASISLTKWTSNPYSNIDNTSNVTSSVVTFAVQDKTQSSVSIQNLSTPIQITINRKNIQYDKTKKSVCKYFDKTKNTWETDGLNFVSETADSILCNCTHLTDFGGSLDDIVTTTVISTNTESSENWYPLDNNFGIFTCVIYFICFFMIAILLYFFKFSKYEPIPTRSPTIKHYNQDSSAIRALQKDESPVIMKSENSPQVKTEHIPENIETIKILHIYNISPIYSIFHSRDNDECRRRVSGFIIYLMLVSMFLACLYSSPDLDVLK